MNKTQLDIVPKSSRRYPLISFLEMLKHSIELWSLASQPVSTTSRHESQGNKHGPYDWYDFKTTDTPLALQLNIEQALWGAMVSRDAKFFRNNR